MSPTCRIRGGEADVTPAHHRAAGVVVAALALLGGAGLTGCGAGQTAETQVVGTAIDPANAAAGPILLRAAYVQGPAEEGEEAPVMVRLYNRGAEQDALTSVRLGPGSQDLAGGVEIQGGAGGRVPIPADAFADVNPADYSISITGLRRKLLLGTSVSLVFTFDKAGEEQVAVPVTPEGGSAGTPDVSEEPAEPEAEE
jgi:copper(I)-binding protein